MSRRPDTGDTIKLALELLKRIPRGRKVTATELQVQLANAGHPRELRTIQRQLETLSDQFEIERDTRSKPYGYRWRDRSTGFAVPALTPHEALLLALAEEHLRSLLPAALLRSMAGFFTQARSQLADEPASRRERAWLNKVRVIREAQPLLPPKLRPGVFDQVSEALYRDLWLEIDYINSSGKRRVHKVMPLGLAQQGPRLYLVCRYEGFEDNRSLALHRFHAARATTLGFSRPRDFDLQRCEAEGQFAWGRGRRVRLRFRIDKESGLHLTETPLSADQTVTDLGTYLEIAATVADTQQLDWWLAGFGDRLEILQREPLAD
jgi:predicted DNA-binding transcriptional regulator YafY